VRPEFFLILSKTPSQAVSKSSGESILFRFGAVGWKIVGESLKQALNAFQSRLLNAVRNLVNETSIESGFETGRVFSCDENVLGAAIITTSNPHNIKILNFICGSLRDSEYPILAKPITPD
jgi:hypothetical protein